MLTLEVRLPSCLNCGFSSFDELHIVLLNLFLREKCPEGGKGGQIEPIK